MRDANDRIRELREQMGISQTELAAAARITQAAISAIERGEVKSPSLETARNIARALGTTIEELFPVEPDNCDPTSDPAPFSASRIRPERRQENETQD